MHRITEKSHRFYILEIYAGGYFESFEKIATITHCMVYLGLINTYIGPPKGLYIFSEKIFPGGMVFPEKIGPRPKFSAEQNFRDRSWKFCSGLRFHKKNRLQWTIWCKRKRKEANLVSYCLITSYLAIICLAYNRWLSSYYSVLISLRMSY